MIPNPPTDAASDAATAEVSQASLLAFLRAGGVLGLSEWLVLDSVTQAALERAGTALWAERAMALAACMAGGAGMVADLADGGEASEDRRLEALLNRALAGGRVPHG